MWILLALSTQFLYSQKIRFDHLTIENGLSNGRVTCFTQDSTGFFWVGTNDGLNRYDGLKFKVYSHHPSDTTTLVGNSIQDLLNEGENVWVCTNKGIDYYRSSDEIFYHIPIIGAGNNTNISVGKIYKDFKGDLFIATHNGIFIFNKKRRIFEKSVFSGEKFQDIENTEFTYITQDRDNIFWLGTQEHGVITYNAVTRVRREIEQISEITNTLLNNKIFCIYEDNHHTVWIGTNEGLYAYSKPDGNITRYLTDPNKQNWLPHITVNQISEDSRNNLWLATNKGLSIFNRKNGTFINYFHDDFDESSLGNNSAHCLYEDFQHNLWIGSGENGINIIKSHSIEFENFKRIPNNPNSLNYDYVLSVIEDRLGNVWIGTNGWGINQYDAKTKKFKYFIPPSAAKGGSQTAAITCLYEDKSGKIWIGTYLGGLSVYNPENKKYTTYAFDSRKPNGLTNNVISAVKEDSKGKIWIATNGGGVNIFDPETKKFSQIRASKNSISSDYCVTIFEDKQKNIWIGTFYGLNKYDPVNGKNVVFLNSSKAGSISSDVINSIYQDSKDRIWIGTEFGLNFYNPNSNSFTTYTIDDGLPNNVINGILEDNRGNLWLSSNKGLSRFNPDDKKVINYDTQDGLVSSFFYHGAYYRNKNGLLYFGGAKGVTYFNPDKTKHSKYLSPLVFTDFFVYNKSISPKGKNSVLSTSISKTRKIELNHDQSFIAIEFAALNYINSSKDNYSYFLEGLDRQWNYIGNQRVASYTNLPAGNYTFYVKVVNENGSETQSSLKIYVKPAWWKTNLAYTFYFILFCGLAYFIYSYIHSKTLYKHNLQIERIEKEKAIEINQAKIRFFINVSHEFKTPLTLIISPLEKLISSSGILRQDEQNQLYHLIYRNTLRLSRLINQIMDLRKLDTGNIKLYATRNDLVNFIQEISLSFESHAKNHNIDFTIHCPYENIIVWFDVDKLEKVIYNTLSNAFRYTMDGKSVQVSVEVVQPDYGSLSESSNYKEGFVKIQVIDQGRGIPEALQEKIFSRFYQVQTETLANPASSGVGLSIAKEFIEMHHGKIYVKSKPKAGSTFTVELPLGNNHFDKEELAPEVEIDQTPQRINVQELENTDADNTENGQKKKYKILVVEDNFELRTFLKDNLDQKYNVLEAANGKDGLQLVRDQMPDIVVSDVMMPFMNGIDLCKNIKSDIKTSHIPVILLTVLNSINNQVEGFEIGADDYITKPFNLNLLEARIFNLIETRKKLVKKFIEEIKPDPKRYSHNTLDEKFIQKAVEVVEKNLSNIEFSAEDFADQTGMSRSNLHIKLKALTNQSATEFIRLIRLKKAAELLSVNKYNISEVSFMVGFNSISYFNRCFKQQFNLTPSEFMENSQNTGFTSEDNK